MKYRIIHRKDDKLNVTDYNYHIEESRHYDKPLCGLTSYMNKIKLGDIVSVVLLRSIPTLVKGETHIDLNEQYKNQFVFNKVITRKIREEHLFKIISVPKKHQKKNGIYGVEKCENTRVIREDLGAYKKYKRTFQTEQFDIYDLTHYYFYEIKKTDNHCSDNFVERFIENPYEYINPQKWKYYSKYFYEPCYFYANNELISKICDIMVENYDKIDDVNKVKMRTMEEIIETNKKYMDEAIKYFGEEITMDVYCSVYPEDCQYAAPMIKPNITQIRYSDIYRVYNTEPNDTFAWCHTEFVTNWRGATINEKARYALRVGRVVRVMCCYKKKFHKKNKDDVYADHVIYFELLHKIDDLHFLAKVRNNCTEQIDDIVIALDIRAISEIPIGRVDDELSEYDNKTGMGRITGIWGSKITDELHDMCMWYEEN
jgi:hypothetical protein